MSQLQFLGRQLVGAVALSGMAPEVFENAEAILDKSNDPMAVVAWRAYKSVRTANPLALAASMNRYGGSNITADVVNQEILSLATRWTPDGKPINPRDVYASLTIAYQQISNEEKVEKIAQQIKLHKITFQQAASEMNEMATTIDRPEAFSSSSSWGDKAMEFLQRRKSMYDENRMLTWPLMFKTLRERMPEIEPGILACVIAQSGVGKSMFISQMVDHWALNHKHNILNCSTELPEEILLWRRVSKFVNQPLDRIKRGLVDQAAILDCLSKYKEGGEIVDYFCPGATIDQLINNAHKIKGHIMVDYFDMLDLSKSRMFGKHFDSNKTDAVGYALTALKEYATSEGKVVWVVLQTGKEAAPKLIDGKIVGEQKLKLENGMDSVRFRHRANLGIALNFPIVTHHDVVTAPASKKKIEERVGTFSCMGEGMIVKDSFSGQEGLKFPLFRDGPRSSIYEYSPTMVPISSMSDRPSGESRSVADVAAPAPFRE